MTRTLFISGVVATCLYASALHYCSSPNPQPEYTPQQKKSDIALMKKHGADVLMVKWDDSVWITRNGQMIRIK
jgi:hypothetical protein